MSTATLTPKKNVPKKAAAAKSSAAKAATAKAAAAKAAAAKSSAANTPSAKTTADNTPFIKVYVNNDDATIVWHYPQPIENCWGFAVYRKRKGESDADAEPVFTSVGFADDPHTAFETRPSTEWPIQKYMWIDYFVNAGDEVCYRVVPMIGNPAGATGATAKSGKPAPKGTVGPTGTGTVTLTKASDLATPWTDMVKIGDNGGIEAYFNRGLVSSQFLAKRLNNIPKNERTKSLKSNLADPKSSIRTFMGGNLLQALTTMLNEVATDGSLQLYAALYELDEFSLIDGLNKIGKRAHVILANGAFSSAKPDPQAANAKKLTKVDVTRRKVGTPHFAHNKFIVITKNDVPLKVFTGSTNWTMNGVFTQINNAVVLHDPEVAKYYKDEWDAIKADCDKSGNGLYSDTYKKHNSTAKTNTDKSITTYFTPVPKTIDMQAATTYIENAKHGILFLMFKPGVEGKSLMLYDVIMKMADNKNLLVNGVLNADPGGAKTPTIKFLTNNKPEDGDLDAVLPAAINEDFQFWQDEVAKQNVTIHSKCIVIDPFSNNPVLITGSHNMGDKASKSNDDNLNIILGNKPLAQAYAINMMGVYHHYRWRFYRSKKTSAPKWDGNSKSDEWQQWYATGEKATEIKFWCGE